MVMEARNTIPLVSGGWMRAERQGGLGVITLNRPQALNALSLAMIRDLRAVLEAWQADEDVLAVLLQGAHGKTPAFCAGGDIRFFHAAALAGDPALEDFFTEEYALDHLIHRYRKPCIALLDGIVMGGGMGIGQGAALRITTERSKLAMPETNIGLFPDVGGGWFLSRCPGRVGEFLGLTGQVLGSGDALAWGLSDGHLRSEELPALVDELARHDFGSGAELLRHLRGRLEPAPLPQLGAHRGAIDRHFSLPSLQAIVASLEADADAWAQQVLAALRKRSPLMLAVTLEQIRRARRMTLADELRMERGMMRRGFHLRPGAAGEGVEGIRALAVDKDHRPRWSPATIEELVPEMVAPFFDSPWPAGVHPLRDLG